MFSGDKAHLVEDESEVVSSCDVLNENCNEGHGLPEILEREAMKGVRAEAEVERKNFLSS